MKLLLLSFWFFFTGCASYQATVAGRSDSLSGYSKDGNYGGVYTHSVTYR